MVRYFTNSGELLRSVDYVLREIPVEPFYEVVECETGKVMKWRLNNKGYVSVSPSFNGKQMNCTLHRLILSTFDPLRYFNSAQVNHIDENKLNDKLENLEWISCIDNNNHGTRNQRVGEGMKGVHINRKDQSKSVLQFTKDGTFVAEYPSTHEAHRQTGIFWQSISSCCNRKYKSAGGFIWKFKEAD